MQKELFLLLFCIFLATSEFTPFRAKIEGEMITGMYWMDVLVGSPSQKLRLHIDTGSNLMIVESASCKTCNHHFEGYNTDNSSTTSLIGCSSASCDANTCTYRLCRDTSKCASTKCCSRKDPSLCGFYVSYGDGSTAEGGLTRDTMIVVNRAEEQSNAVTTTFGLILEEQGTWSHYSDGLLGLAYDSLYCSPTCYKTWMDEYYLSNKPQGARDIFSICLGETEGLLSVGELDRDLYAGNMYWVDVQDPAYYSVRIKGLHVSNHSISLTLSTAIIDSGTTLLLLPPAMFSSFQSLIKTHYPDAVGISGDKTFFNGYSIAIDPTKSWPPLYVSLEGVVVRIPPSVYFLKLPQNGRTYYYLGIAAGSNQYILLGDSFMRGLTIVHDREKDVLGFAVPSETCYRIGDQILLSVEGAYSILNNYDPREDKWYNDTSVEIPESSWWDDVVRFVYQYLFEIIMALLILVLIGNLLSSCCCKKTKKSVPIRVRREAKKNIGVPYNRGFDTQRTDCIIPEGSVIELRVVSQEDDSISTQQFVLTHPIHVNPVAPPKPKEYLCLLKQIEENGIFEKQCSFISM